ncbi:family 3 glycoside hydrolase [Dactylonectria estremocensis]|uniref:beta-glucosidase n=1 Tax=Dactylonectria estremocensis TaxID=1079267 RepID=A0A9P9IN40_9HYPO|nr:family 3 glycoside hydrolase [Dactylonectria estremocensis]
MDASREGLLKPARRPTEDDGYDSDEQFEFEDAGYDEIPLHSRRKSLLPSKERQARWVAGYRAFCSPKRRCCLVFLLIILAIWAIISVLGAFNYDKIKITPPNGLSPPWYPSPKGGTAKQWAESYKKAAALVSKMTLPEKVNITTGTGWSMGLAVGNTGPALKVGFPGLALQDGPLGIRMADNATAFPAGITVGATWNKELMYEHGKAHALEARGKGINILLGPCVGPLGRMPAGGRNWEGFGPDPYLQGIGGSQTVKGIQDQGVMATIKHFIGNEQEHFRQSWEWALPNALSSNIDDRTLHELYAWPFADAVKAGVASVMCSYNMVNNSYACGNSKLLNGILKDEMGFQGFVMSDWLAQRSGVASALSGLDMSMPGDGLKWQDGDSLWGPQMTTAILNGSLPVDRLNDMVVRIVASWYQLGQDNKKLFNNTGPNFSSWTLDKFDVIAPGSSSPQEKVEVNKYVNVQSNHSLIARQIAVEGTVLLRNDAGILPLTRNGTTGSSRARKATGKLRVGIFGDDAGPGHGPNYCPDRGCNQGTLGSGWGSGAVEFPYLVPPVDALKKGFNNKKVNVTGFLSNGVRYSQDPHAFRDQDICIVFANSDAGEGYLAWGKVSGDRNDLFLQNGGNDLILEVADHCGDGSGSTIVVMHAVGPVVVERWIDHPRIKAVLAANLPGQESGNAIASIIFGDESPSGKLPYTIGKTLDEYGEGGRVMYQPNAVVPQQNFDEGLFVDYRHFDKYGITPRFEFGFGLSYTSFEYKNLKVTQRKKKTALPAKRPTDAAKPPHFDKAIPGVKDSLFPSDIRKLKNYIYPYVESASDIKKGHYPYPDGYDVKQPLSEAGGAEGGNPDLWETYVTVSVVVSNNGSVAGKAVPQLYLSYPDTAGVEFPVRALRGFEKPFLKKGESKTVKFDLTRRDLSYWDVGRQNWVMLVDGEYGFAVGESSRDVKVKGTW